MSNQKENKSKIPYEYKVRDQVLLETPGILRKLCVSSNKCVTIMALKPNQLQVTTGRSQANAIIERVRKVVNDMLRSFDLENENNHENIGKYESNSFDYFLQSTAWKMCIRSTYHTTLEATPCQLVFGRDMIHNIAFRANWDRIQKRKQDIINMSNQKETRVKFLKNIRLETK
jgi:hypothetical protein